MSEGNLVLEDCAISSTGIGVSISGPGNCTLRRCQVHTDGDEGAGVIIAKEGQATLEECEIFGTIQAGTNIEDQDVKNIGVAIGETGSTATLHNCRIHNYDVGILFGMDGAGKGMLEAEWCDIHHCGVSVAIGAQSSVILSHCKIHDHTEGIVIMEQGQGAIEDCDIFGSIRSGISVKDSGSTATLRRCQIHDGQSMGIMLADEGKAEVEECTIYRNTGPGIKIQNSTATIERCNIHKGKYLGVSISEAGNASLKECHILGNTGVGIRLSGANSKANVSGCHFHGGNAVGIVIEDEGEGVIEDCHFDKNGTDVYVEPGSHFTRT